MHLVIAPFVGPIVGILSKTLKSIESDAKSGVIKINDKKKEEFKLLEDFFSNYYKIFDEDLFPKNCYLECSESPDFIVKFDNQKNGVELTRAIDEKIMKSQDLEIEIYKIVRKYINDALSKRKVYPIMQSMSARPQGKKAFFHFTPQLTHEQMEKGFALLPIQKYQIVFHLLPLFQYFF
ncbi:hypothetical protein HWHPT5561_09790 [Petrotoga sp. HWH.PT.55.6.1]|uniref:hypothetical protein n=1 Tax=unclassified Petrotoga TaxID=2620614 RepID=UPI000CA08D87|nr:MULTISPECIES: hypothetical protein [unclassified Petrotoga]PNR91781.1 hypothetical protein X926_08085 [Petrotoga sp. HWHPT.55.6.3]RPD35012.1 hypothetical protein HWHPT5561_09790 [Petrotoga sp. HWH.PT.55.6.1]